MKTNPCASGPRRAFLAPVLLLLAPLSVAFAGAPEDEILLRAKTCPFIVPIERVRVEIHGIVFQDKVDGAQALGLPTTGPGDPRFRFAIATLKITRPIGLKVPIAAAALSLHYCHGKEEKVARALGISDFTKDPRGAPKPLFVQRARPGRVKWIADTLPAEPELYIAAVFAVMEPDIRECWLGVAQPSSLAPFQTSGWR